MPNCWPQLFIPFPLHEPISQTFSSNQKYLTFFITCLIFDKLMGTFFICSTWVLVRYWSGGMFYFLFPMSHILIKLILVRPLGNFHVLIKGFSLLWYKPIVNCWFFNCCVILSCMIDACGIANRKGFWYSPVALQ